MLEITISIVNDTDQKRFDWALAQIVAIAATSPTNADAMITVHTNKHSGHITKKIRCAEADALSHFISKYDRNLCNS